MKRTKAVMTIYMGVVTILLISMIMTFFGLAQRARKIRRIGRDCDLASEMLFSAYTRPLADRYGLFVLDMPDEGTMTSYFRQFMNMNLESEGLETQNITCSDLKDLKADDWEGLIRQIERCESYELIQTGMTELTALCDQISQTDVSLVDDYDADLTEAAALPPPQMPDENRNGNNTNPGNDEPSLPQVRDPREGIADLLKGGVLTLAMGDMSCSGKTVDLGACSYQVPESSGFHPIKSFESIGYIRNMLSDTDLSSLFSDALDAGQEWLLLNAYGIQFFGSLRPASGGTGSEGSGTAGSGSVGSGSAGSGSGKWSSALDYEMEYLISGRESDRENLENVLSSLLAIRTLMNLVYLYTDSGKTSMLMEMATSLTAAAALPIAGPALCLLLMICWAGAEAAVDLNAMTHGKRVPLLKTDSSWQLSLEALQGLALSGGNLSAYTKDSAGGLSYDRYLQILYLMTPGEVKFVRMTQLMEMNTRLSEGYEAFAFGHAYVGAAFSGEVQLEGQKVTWQTTYSYLPPDQDS